MRLIRLIANSVAKNLSSAIKGSKPVALSVKQGGDKLPKPSYPPTDLEFEESYSHYLKERESQIREKLNFNEISLQDLCTEIMRARAVDLAKDTMESVRRSYWMEQSETPYDKIMKQLGQCFDKIVAKPTPSNVPDRPSFSPFRHLKALDRYVEETCKSEVFEELNSVEMTAQGLYLKLRRMQALDLLKDTKERLSRSHEMTPELKNPYDENNEEIDYDKFEEKADLYFKLKLDISEENIRKILRQKAEEQDDCKNKEDNN